MAIALALFHEVRSLGRERLGVSCGLRGNGMCFSHPRPPRGAARRVLASWRTWSTASAWAAPATACTTRTRPRCWARWSPSEKAAALAAPALGGRALGELTKQFGVPLLREALAKRDDVLLDLALDLLVPPLSHVGGWARWLRRRPRPALVAWLGHAALAAWVLAGCTSPPGACYVLRGLVGVGHRARGGCSTCAGALLRGVEGVVVADDPWAGPRVGAHGPRNREAAMNAETRAAEKSREAQEQQRVQQQLLGCLRSPWQSLVVVPAQPGGDAAYIAEALANVAWLVRGKEAKVFQVQGLDVAGASKVIVDMDAHVAPAGWRWRSSSRWWRSRRAFRWRWPPTRRSCAYTWA